MGFGLYLVLVLMLFWWDYFDWLKIDVIGFVEEFYFGVGEFYVKVGW